MDFKQGGQVIQRMRKEQGLTQEQLAEKVSIAPNSVSRIERGGLIPALPTLIGICNALQIGADVVLAAYISADTPIRWSFLSDKFERMELEKQYKVETILNCIIDVI